LELPGDGRRMMRNSWLRKAWRSTIDVSLNNPFFLKSWDTHMRPFPNFSSD
jgi:hypothetical protein